MIKLKNFSLNKDSDSNEIFEKIKIYIDEYAEQDLFQKILKNFSSIFRFPDQVILKKFKRLVYGEFNANNSSFNKNFNIVQILLSFFLIVVATILIFLFGKKNFKINKYDLIFDNIENERQINKFRKLSNKFEKTLFITNTLNLKNKVLQNNLNAQCMFSLIPSKIFLENNLFKILKFFVFILIFSLKKKENLLFFFQKIYFSIIKNDTLFQYNKSKILLMDRFYKTCPIKNFFFKKSKGKIVACAQYHLAESGISFYTDMDTLFTFGDEQFTKKKLIIFGGRVENSIPTGSLSMEDEFYGSKKNLNKINNFDLLLIGINTVHWCKVSNKIFASYYLFLKWVVKFSKENPNVKILYKHHASFSGDKIEKEIFKDSNIPIISKDKNNTTYQYLEKCKFAISYGSTMILEGLSLKKNCFFVDPNKNATTFYSHHDFDEKIFLSDYGTFKSEILQILNKEDRKKEILHDRVCLKSDIVSDRIFKYLSNIN